jgi:hypothetical protein
MPRTQKAERLGPASPKAYASPDLTNSFAIAFYAAIWTVVAAIVAHTFFRY